MYQSALPNLSTEYGIEKVRKEYKKLANYQYIDSSHIILENMEETVCNLQIIFITFEFKIGHRNSLRQIDETSRIVLMGDKGHKTTKITTMFPDITNRPQAPFNQLPVMVWPGSDKYDELLKASEIYNRLVSTGAIVFIGGDTLFLSNILGTSCSATFPCFQCLFEAKDDVYFDDNDYTLRTSDQMKKAIKFALSNKKARAGVFRKAIWPIEPEQVS